MKEVLDSLTTTLRERLVSPLAGAFIVSWLIINYKVVVVLTSGMKPHVKFPYIEDVIWRDSYGLWMNSLVYPAIAALLYILIYPWPARWLLKYSLYQQNITKLMKITVEGNHPVTREELEEAKQKWAEKFRKQGEAIQRLEVQIEDEQKKVEELTQAEQKMAARANQLSADLVAAQAENEKIKNELDKLNQTGVYQRPSIRDFRSGGFSRERAAKDGLSAIHAGHYADLNWTDMGGMDDDLFLRDGRVALRNSSGQAVVPMHALYDFSLLLRDSMEDGFIIDRQSLERLAAIVENFETQDADELTSQMSAGKVDIDRFSPEGISAVRRCFNI